MSPCIVRHENITWWQFVNAPKRALQYASSTDKPVHIILEHGVDSDPRNRCLPVATHVILSKAAYDELVAGQGS